MKPTLLIPIDRARPEPLQAQLCEGIKELITSGVLGGGQNVPSSRDLAHELGVSRNTVMAAYDRLIGEGYLSARARTALVVNPLKLSVTPPAAPKTRRAPRRPAAAQETGMIGAIPFRPAQPDVELFPLALWNRARNRALDAAGPRILRYQESQRLGYTALRKSLAAYMRSSRGVVCHWRQVMVTSGSQQALFLLAHLLAEPGERVLMEDPAYPGALAIWKARKLRIEPAPVDELGLVPPLAARAGYRFLYTTPSRQYPLGACLPVARRMELIRLIERTGAYLIEDDYDSEFRYTHAPVPSVQSLDTTGRVIYVGTTSKALFPSLRIGYMVLPEALIEAADQLRDTMDDQGPLIDQATLAEFINSGAFYTHIRRCRREYSRRRDAFLEAMQANHVPLEFPHADGGINIAGILAPGAVISDEPACRAALDAEGIEAPLLSRYCLESHWRGFLFGFTAHRPARIAKDVARFARSVAPHIQRG